MGSLTYDMSTLTPMALGGRGTVGVNTGSGRGGVTKRMVGHRYGSDEVVGWSGSTFAADQRIEAVFPALFGDSESWALALRWADPANHYFVRYSKATLELRREVGGSETLLASTKVGPSLDLRGTTVIGFEVVGTSPAELKVEYDGVEVLTYSNATVQLTAGIPGFFSSTIVQTYNRVRYLENTGGGFTEVADYNIGKGFDERHWLAVIELSRTAPGTKYIDVVAGGWNIYGDTSANILQLTNTFMPLDGSSCSLKFKSTSSNSSNQFAVGFQVDPSRVIMALASSTNTLTLYETSHYSTLTSLGTVTVTSVGGWRDGLSHTLLLKVDGTAVTAYVDGILKLSGTANFTGLTVGQPYVFLKLNADSELTTIEEVIVQGADATAPTTPSITTGKGAGTNGVTVTWDAPDADVIKVILKRDSTVLGTWNSDLGDTLPTGYNDVPSSGSYTYTVEFHDHDLNISSQTTLSVTVPVVFNPNDPGAGPIAVTVALPSTISVTVEVT